MLDLISLGDDFYGIGSTISEPPTVFLPSSDPRSTYEFVPMPLTADSRNGELYGIAASDDQHFVVVGSNQDTHGGVIFWCSGDPSSLGNWHEVNLDAVVEDHGVLRDVHVVGSNVLAVGERYPQQHGGLALLSHDGGATWQDVTPPDAPLLWNCWLHPNGRMVVTSGEYTAIF